MAHIQRRGVKGSYRYRVRYIDDAGRERSKTFVLKGDADRFVTSVSHQILAGTYVDPASGKITVKQFGEQWRLNQSHLRPKSSQSLEQAFRVHVYPFLGHRTLSGLRPSDLAAWQRGRLKPVGPLGEASVYRIRSQMSSMFKAAITDRVIHSNPFASVKAPSVDRPEIVPITLEQVRELEKNLILKTRGAKDIDRYQAVIPLITGSGLRASEVFGLTVDRIDFLRRQIRVNRQLVGREPGGAPIFGPPKTPSSVRTVPIADVTVLALSEHLRKYPAGPYGLVFTTGRGGAVTREVFGKVWRPAAESIGLEVGDGLHLVRHLYASMLIAGGRSVKEVQKRLGHKSAVETLDTYSHLWPDNEDGTRAAIEAALARPSEAVTEAARPY